MVVLYSVYGNNVIIINSSLPVYPWLYFSIRLGLLLHDLEGILMDIHKTSQIQCKTEMMITTAYEYRIYMFIY